MMKKNTIKLDWGFLERIAEYYEFPSPVFLSDEIVFKHKKRSQARAEKAELFDQIVELVDRYKG